MKTSYNYNMEVNNNNLMLNSQVMKSSFSPIASMNSKAKGAVYAEKGQPMYQKDMDKDEDGIITLQEFNDYCDENDISYAQRKQMLENRLQYQLNTEHAKASEEVRKIQPEIEKVYAEEGDEEYDKAMDEDGDGKVTYDEYMKYCNEQEETKEKEPSNAKMEREDEEVVIKNPVKAVSTYEQTEKGDKEGKIEEKA